MAKICSTGFCQKSFSLKVLFLHQIALPLQILYSFAIWKNFTTNVGEVVGEIYFFWNKSSKISIIFSTIAPFFWKIFSWNSIYIFIKMHISSTCLYWTLEYYFFVFTTANEIWSSL